MGNRRARRFRVRSLVRVRRQLATRAGCGDARPWRTAAAGVLALALVLGSAQPGAGEDAAGGAADGSAEQPGSWYVATIANTGASGVVTHYWSKGRKFRAESVVAGRRIITIVDGPHYYILDPVQGAGVRIERSAKAIADDASGVRPLGQELEEMIAAGGELVRREEMRGQPVEVYQLTDSKGRRRLWVTSDVHHLPYRRESFDRRSQLTSSVDYTGWYPGIPIADSFFTPDSTVPLEEFSYEEFRERAARGPVGPAPVLFGTLLHGKRAEE